MKLAEIEKMPPMVPQPAPKLFGCSFASTNPNPPGELPTAVPLPTPPGSLPRGVGSGDKAHQAPGQIEF